MDKSMSQTLSYQPFSLDWSLQSAPSIGQFELGSQELIKRISHVLRGGYQQLMPQSNWSSATWNKRTPNFEAPPSLPLTISPIGENVDSVERVRECVSIKQRGRQVVTAVRTLDHRLKLFSWRVNADGSVVRTGASNPLPGRVAQIALARARKFVTAFRTAGRQLQLVSWDVSNTGAIYQAGASVTRNGEVADEVNKVKLVALNDHLLLTACTTPTGQLVLSSWRLNDDDSLTRLQDAMPTAEQVRELVPVVLPAGPTGARLLLVICTEAGQLKLQGWEIAQNGELQPTTPPVETDEKVSRFDAVLDSEGRLVTSLRLANGRLKLVAWAVAPDGRTIQRLCDSGAKGERIRQHALMAQPSQVLTAIQTVTGQVKLVAWAISSTPVQDRALVCVGDALIQNVALVAPGFCQEPLDGNAPILTNSITTDGTLKLLTWRA